MSRNLRNTAFAGLCGLYLSFPTPAVSQVSTADALREIEPRLRAIYERGEYRAKPFRAEWLPDSSGYVVRAPVAGGTQTES